MKRFKPQFLFLLPILFLSLMLVALMLVASPSNSYDKYESNVEVVVQFPNLTMNDADLIRWNVLQDRSHNLNPNDSMSLIFKKVDITNTAYFFQNATLHIEGNFYKDQNNNLYSTVFSKSLDSNFAQTMHAFHVGDMITMSFQDENLGAKELNGKVVQINKTLNKADIQEQSRVQTAINYTGN